MIWMMFPGMLLCNMWKERNNHIFKNEKHGEEKVWQKLVNNLQEKFRGKKWGEREKEFTEVEARIVEGWEIGKEDLEGQK